MRYQGRVTQWKDDKGFGFITPNGGGDSVFVHIKAFANRERRPAGNELVTYELTTDAQGRGRAEKVAFVGERIAPPRRSGSQSLPVLLTVAFVAALLVGALTGRLPMAVPLLYAIASVIAFVAYWWDKSAARNGQWRTPESTLHVYSLVGGWPGALAAQRLLRHKSSKGEFQSVYWVTVVINCALLAWLVSSDRLRLIEELVRGI
jgi:uncharacterized membrane protein YsdA (DUF1294 family)/cold shock CspA family protein